MIKFNIIFLHLRPKIELMQIGKRRISLLLFNKTRVREQLKYQKRTERLEARVCVVAYFGDNFTCVPQLSGDIHAMVIRTSAKIAVVFRIPIDKFKKLSCEVSSQSIYDSVPRSNRKGRL